MASTGCAGTLAVAADIGVNAAGVRQRPVGIRVAGLHPIIVGLILASGPVSAQAADDTRVKVGLTTAVSLVVWRTTWAPVWLRAVGAVLGAARLR